MDPSQGQIKAGRTTENKVAQQAEYTTKFLDSYLQLHWPPVVFFISLNPTNSIISHYSYTISLLHRGFVKNFNPSGIIMFSCFTLCVAYLPDFIWVLLHEQELLSCICFQFLFYSSRFLSRHYSINILNINHIISGQ